jgi:hypothetical protein
MSNQALGVTGQLAAARKELERACDLLLAPSPEALDRCADLLQAAVAQVTASQAAIATPAEREPGAAAEGRRLQSAVRRARRLLDAAAEYHQNWARRMGTLSAGYDSRGEPAAVERGRRLIVRG